MAVASSIFVVAMTRTSTWIVSVPPTLSKHLSCNTRSNFACILMGISPISSRKIVPVSARSKRPIFLLVAPVKAPFSWPNSSLSNSWSGRAAQFTATKGLSARLLALYISRAATSLPVPLSPVIRTVAPVFATCRIKRLISFIGALRQTILPYFLPNS